MVALPRLRFPKVRGVRIKGCKLPLRRTPVPRKAYTRGFKLQALQMMTDQSLSVAEVARRLGVRDNLLRNWKKAAQARGADAFPSHGNPSPAEDELRRLQAEVHRLRAERDPFTKAAAYFANPPT
jgi:transposase